MQIQETLSGGANCRAKGVLAVKDPVVGNCLETT